MKDTVGVIGMGKLGLCLALNLERAGHRVIGVEKNKERLEALQNKSHSSSEPQVEEYLKKAVNWSLSASYEDLLREKCSVVFIVVATPSLSSGSYDHSQVEAVWEELKRLGKRKENIHLVVNCTTMPGYCEQLATRVNPYNYTLSYNPEFIAQGSIIRDQQYPDQVLIGSNNSTAAQKLEDIYRSFVKSEANYCHMSLISAEICKLATNCFLTTKISFANAIGDLATKVGAEPDKILQAVGADSRIGTKYLKYGFGYGGPCFPRDNRALGKFSEENEYDLLLSRATDESNRQHLNFQFEQWKQQEGEYIEFDQVSYKKGSDILEESQQLALAIKLAKAGKKVLVKEKKSVINVLKRLHGNLFEYKELKE
jgi:nucleotide sugar dehydrogenase